MPFEPAARASRTRVLQINTACCGLPSRAWDRRNLAATLIAVKDTCARNDNKFAPVFNRFGPNMAEPGRSLALPGSKSANQERRGRRQERFMATVRKERSSKERSPPAAAAAGRRAAPNLAGAFAGLA